MAGTCSSDFNSSFHRASHRPCQSTRKRNAFAWYSSDVDNRNEKWGYKIRQSQTQKSLSACRRGPGSGKQYGNCSSIWIRRNEAVPFDKFLAMIDEDIAHTVVEIVNNDE